MRLAVLLLLAYLNLAASSDPLQALRWEPPAAVAEALEAGELERAAELCRELGDPLGEACCLARLGNLERALAVLPASAPAGGRMALERLRADQLRGQDRHEQAESLLRQAAARYQPGLEQEGALVYKDLGNLLSDFERLDEARASYLRAGELAGQIGDTELLARLTWNLGLLDVQEGHYEKGLEKLEQARGQLPDPLLQASIDVNRATALSRLGRDREAEQAYLAAIPALPPGPAGTAWLNLAGLYQRQKRHAEAYQALDQAEQRLTDRRQLASIMLTRGNLLVDQSRMAEGLVWLEKALALFRELGLEPAVATTLGSLGSAHLYLGHYEAAHRSLTESVAILTRLGRKPELAVVMAQWGEYWQQLGDLEQAVHDLLTARMLLAEQGMIEEERRVLSNLARLALLANQPGQALKLLEQGKPTASAGPALLSSHQHALGMALWQSGRTAQGLATLQAALSQAGEEQRAAILQDLGTIEQASGQLEAAREHYEQAMRDYRRLGLSGSALYAQLAWMQSLIGLDRRDQALEVGQEALQGLQQLRREVLLGSGSRGVSLLGAMYEELPRQLAGLYLSQRQDADQALQALESWRGFNEHAWRVTLLRAERHPESARALARARELVLELAPLEALRAEGKATPEQLVRRNVISSEMARLELELLRQERPLDSAPDAEGIRSRLPGGAALLEYALLPDGWHLFVITGKGLHHARLENVPAVTRLRHLLTQNDPGLGQASVAMHQALLGPALPWLEEVDRLLIVADGPLQDLPFEILQDASGSYLVERFSLAYLNTARELWEPRPLRPGGKALVMGGPDYGPGLWSDLPGSREEARLIQQQVGGELVIGQAASEDAFCSQAPGHKLVHLATHGFAGASTARWGRLSTLGAEQAYGASLDYLARKTGVVFAGANLGGNGKSDGILRPLEVFQLDLRGTELVVLSACQTALGQKTGSEGILGLRRAFRATGVRWLVLSLWKVDDQATRALMVRFYGHYLAGLDPGQALRAAQLELLRGSPELVRLKLAGTEKQFSAPYFWGPFIAVGVP